MNIRKLLQTGETETVEFKSTFGKEVIISLSAFANTAGGKVVVGVDNAGRPTGLEVGPETEQRYVNEIKTATYPQIIPNATAFDIDGRTILVLEINEYPVKPVSCKNRYYKRVKNSNHLLSLDEIVDLQQQSLNLSFDANPLKEDLSSLDPEAMNRFFAKVNTTGRATLQDDPLANLTKLKFIQNGKPTLAAKLLFGDHGYSIHMGRFKSPDTIIDDLMLKEPLPVAIEEAMIFIKKHINLSFSFDGSLQRKETWQYPLEALRELLLNAIIHRDYRSTSDIIIKIFDDRILFTNPGKLYGNLTVKDLEQDDYVPAHRNRLLAEAFYLTGDIEKYGTGFIRVRKLFEKVSHIALKINETGDFLKVEAAVTPTKTPIKTPTKTPTKTTATLTALEEKILNEIKKDHAITFNRIAAAISISRHTVAEYISKLKTKGVIKRHGGTRGGYWEILVPDNEKE